MMVLLADPAVIFTLNNEKLYNLKILKIEVNLRKVLKCYKTKVSDLICIKFWHYKVVMVAKYMHLDKAKCLTIIEHVL